MKYVRKYKGEQKLVRISMVRLWKLRLSRLEWLIHAQEEAMDLAVYSQKLIEGEQDAMMLNQMLNDIDEQKRNEALREEWEKKEKSSPDWKKKFRNVKGAISYHQRWLKEKEESE